MNGRQSKNEMKHKLLSILLQATQEKNRVSSDMNELRDHLDIKDRKISVLQRKVNLFNEKQNKTHKKYPTNSACNVTTMRL